MSSRIINDSGEPNFSIEGIGQDLFKGDIGISRSYSGYVRLETHRYGENDDNNNGLWLTPDEARKVAINLVKAAQLIEEEQRAAKNSGGN